MYNFKIQFLVSPWLLLLIIPALAVTFWFYFRLDKRYRKTRSRIVSIIFHTIVMVLCICILSGMYFTFDKSNIQNELVILVDSSFTTEDAQSRMDEFVHDILIENNKRNKIAIVKFGYDQKVALEMGKHDAESAYAQYLTSETPNTTASDISAALSFCWNPQTKKSQGDVIHFPESAKILVISDGLETDQDAVTTAKRLSLQGVQIDSTFYPGANITNDVSIVDVSFPDKNYGKGEKFNFSLSIRSSIESAEATITLVDETAQQSTSNEISHTLELGTQTVMFQHSFESLGFHSLKFKIECAGDTIAQNNVYYTYYNIQEVNNILIIEKYMDESSQLSDILTSNVDSQTLQITTMQIDDRLRIPSTVEDMQEYSEIILVNIAHSDMLVVPGFEENLKEYVSVVGGGLLTVGGVELNDGNPVYETKEDGTRVLKMHSYQEDDMRDTIYQSMLPIDAVNYTPPLALAIIIDVSRSMADTFETNGSRRDLAIKGATNLLDELSPEDYVTVVALQDDYSSPLGFTPMTQKNKIANAIRDLADAGTGGTNYSTAIQFACRGLSTFDSEVRKHILLISDGEPGDKIEKGEDFAKIVKENYINNGITTTFISINNDMYKSITQLAAEGYAKAHKLSAAQMGTLGYYLMGDVGFTETSSAIVSDYTPAISAYTSVTSNINPAKLGEIQMNGFFSSRAKSVGNVEISLMALYAPLYAQWNYGNGKVGSFMCDLTRLWSSALLDSEDAGVPLIKNMVTSVLPTVNVQTRSFDATITEDNYRTQVSVLGFDQEEESDYKLVAFVQPPLPEGSQAVPQPKKYDLSAGYRFTFENLVSGIYEITILKVQKSFNLDNVTNLNEIPDSQIFGIFQSYRAFSYSKEYDSTQDSFTTGRELLINISTRKYENDPAEKLVDNPDRVLNDIMDIHKEWDPRLTFTIISIVLFLLDIAVRKFSFLWPNEIIRRLRKRKENAIEQQS